MSLSDIAGYVSVTFTLGALRAWIQRTEKALKPAKQGKLPSLESLVLLQMDASRMQLPEKTVGTHKPIDHTVLIIVD